MKKKHCIPVLVGFGQLINKDREKPGEPLDYMVKCAKFAEEDAEAANILQKIDSLAGVNVISRNYTNEPRKLAEILGATPADIVATPIGATAPQGLTSRLCGRIAKGESEIGLICGAEAFHTGQKKPPLDSPPDNKNATSSIELYGDLRPPLTDLEIKYGLYLPAIVYPIFANAYRKSLGLSLQEAIWEAGKLCEEYSKVAVDNQYAWFRDGKTVEEIATVTKDNRMAYYPYTKYMNAFMNVDQAAAVLIMSEEKANQFGVPDEKRVYLIGCGDSLEKWHISDRVNYYSTPGLKIAFSNAFKQAGIEKEDIDLWDFYNCFPIAAQLVIKTLGLPDEVVPTVTGGLNFFGGPGNNYSLHAICSMADRLRKAPEKKGVVQSITWYISKYSVGIYSGTRPDVFERRDPKEYMFDIDGVFPQKTILKETDGAFEIETYMVAIDRAGEPEYGVIICKDENGARLFARNDNDSSMLKSMTVDEPIGKRARIFYDKSIGLHRFTDII